MDMRIPPLETNILLESNPLKSRILVRRLALGSRAQSLRGWRQLQRRVQVRPGKLLRQETIFYVEQSDNAIVGVAMRTSFPFSMRARQPLAVHCSRRASPRGPSQV